MAELANPLSRAARAIGFDAFGWLTTLFEWARVVLVRLCCVAPPPSICILRCIKWSHQLMDHTGHMQLVPSLASPLFWHFGCRWFPPMLIERPLLNPPNPLLCSVEEARDSAAPKKNEDKPRPPPPRVVLSRLTVMRSSIHLPGSGLTRASATSFDGWKY